MGGGGGGSRLSVILASLGKQAEGHKIGCHGNRWACQDCAGRGLGLIDRRKYEPFRPERYDAIRYMREFGVDQQGAGSWKTRERKEGAKRNRDEEKRRVGRACRGPRVTPLTAKRVEHGMECTYGNDDWHDATGRDGW